MRTPIPPNPPTKPSHEPETSKQRNASQKLSDQLDLGLANGAALLLEGIAADLGSLLNCSKFAFAVW